MVQHAAFPVRPQSPPTAEFLRTGAVSSNAEHLVRYVDDDAAGENRLIEVVPLRPARVQ